MNVGIVGHEAAKFTVDSEVQAKAIIRHLLNQTGAVLVSGGCHLGGIDIWAEEEADRLGLRKVIHKPKKLTWADGFRPRNEAIARDADVMHCVVVRTLPKSYTGMRFDYCYHCKTSEHVKSGGCWTAKLAQRLGKPAVWHTI